MNEQDPFIIATLCRYKQRYTRRSLRIIPFVQVAPFKKVVGWQQMILAIWKVHLVELTQSTLRGQKQFSVSVKR